MNEVKTALQSTSICLPDAHTLPCPQSYLGNFFFSNFEGFILVYSSRGIVHYGNLEMVTVKEHIHGRRCREIASHIFIYTQEAKPSQIPFVSSVQ